MLRVGQRKFSWNSSSFRMAGVKSQKILSIDWSEKVTDELVYSMHPDGVPDGVTSGKWEPEIANTKWLTDGWTGSGLLNPGMSQILVGAAATGVPLLGLTDVEFDMLFQLFEPSIAPNGIGGVVTIIFPVCRVVSVKQAHAEGTKATDIDVGIRVIAPPRTNGVQLASVLRALTGL